MRFSLLAVLLASTASAQLIPGGADLAVLSKAPPKRVAKAVSKTAAKEAVPTTTPAPIGGSGYDYFHLMATPDMAGKPAVITTKKASPRAALQIQAGEGLRDAVASPKPAAK